ncbi:MAG TPA: peptidoglycan DD-metalloendopeptidase family protein [Candidatus Avacidaminococcus intestinavium]|uniref:Peptidoglycan DD-metalloendopeptidase family protein n=1 Tax=Candidatus Avacidaminococcus intestinavium TaxID=2840684 RepID=A0A9D1MQ10_9FIRM|nr:peptidoglycan DD-metalloendopeptidase family protein [Candidatus Avacidaminococcus intestinavium]
MSKIKILSAIVAIIFSFQIITPVLAATIEDRQRELENVRSELYNKEVEREQANKSVESATDKLVEAQGQLSAAQNELAVITTQQDELEYKLNDNLDALETKQKELDTRVGIYRKRLRDIYINGQINYLDVLLGAKDFSDFSSRMFLLRKIVSQDMAMIDDLQEKKIELEDAKAVLEENLQQVKLVRSEVAAKQAVVAQKTREREQIYNDALVEKSRVDQEYEELMSISQNIAAMIRDLESGGGISSASQGSGRFMWPIRGEITSPFGWRTHPIFGDAKFHAGLDIGADYNDSIVAADSGTVIYADWMGGYGNAVMIDHGGGLVTLYAHNNSLTVGEGQQVRKGQMIAYAGSTGYSTGPHCHFEVRLHGEVTNPLDYLP